MFGPSQLPPEWHSDLFLVKKQKKGSGKSHHVNDSHIILVAAQRILPAAEFWVWSLSGPNVGQASSALCRIHLVWGVSMALSIQEHKLCSKLQRFTNPFCSILLLLTNKKPVTSLKGEHFQFCWSGYCDWKQIPKDCRCDCCRISPQSISSEWSPQSSL